MPALPAAGSLHLFTAPHDMNTNRGGKGVNKSRTPDMSSCRSLIGSMNVILKACSYLHKLNIKKKVILNIFLINWFTN